MTAAMSGPAPRHAMDSACSCVNCAERCAAGMESANSASVFESQATDSPQNSAPTHTRWNLCWLELVLSTADDVNTIATVSSAAESFAT